MAAPDPRAYATHKLWLSRQANRHPLKKKRDHSQAMAVCRLVLQYLPPLQFKPEELKMFPKAIVDEAIQAFRTENLPPGYDL